MRRQEALAALTLLIFLALSCLLLNTVVQRQPAPGGFRNHGDESRSGALQDSATSRTLEDRGAGEVSSRARKQVAGLVGVQVCVSRALFDASLQPLLLISCTQRKRNI